MKGKSSLIRRYIIFMPILITGILFCKKNAVAKLPGNYLEVYDKAVSYYFGYPQNKEKAFALLETACKKLTKNRDLHCFNLGQMKELNGNKQEAVKYYNLAYKIKQDGVYKAAAYSLSKDYGKINNKANQMIMETISLCRFGKKEKALRLAEKIGNEYNKSFLISSDLFAQPFFASCFKGLPRYTALIKQLKKQKTKTTNPKDLLFAIRVRQRPFYSLWDFGLRIKSVGFQKSVSYEWKSFIKFTAKRKNQRAVLHLQRFFSILANRKRKSVGETKTKISALMITAVYLIRQDSFFKKIRHYPKLIALVNRYKSY